MTCVGVGSTRLDEQVAQLIGKLHKVYANQQGTFVLVATAKTKHLSHKRCLAVSDDDELRTQLL